MTGNIKSFLITRLSYRQITHQYHDYLQLAFKDRFTWHEGYYKRITVNILLTALKSNAEMDFYAWMVT